MKVDTPYAPIRRVDHAEHATVVDVLTQAFRVDPLVEWLFPDPAGRTERQAGFYRSLLTHPAAEAYLAGDRDGVAIWQTLAAGRAHDQAEADAVVDEGGARLRAVGAALAERHPADRAHVYLPVMGVVGARRGGGLGSALLRHRLRRADYDGVGAYLEASSARSRELYRRHGFTDLGPPVRVADGPPLFPMWRPPPVRTRSVPTKYLTDTYIPSQQRSDQP